MNSLNRSTGALAGGVWGLALVALLLVACGGDADTPASEPAATEAPSEPPAPDPGAILRQAGANFTALKKFHFTLDFDGQTTPIEELGIDMERVEGDIIVPDQLQASVQAKARQLGGITVNIDIIAIGEEAWITNPFDRTVWLPLESGNPLNRMFDPGAGVQAVVRAARDPRVTGEEEVEGKAAWRIEATLDSGDLESFATNAVAGYEVQAVVWVGKEDNAIYRVHLRGRLLEEEPEDILRRLDLSPLTAVEAIEPPQ